MGETEYNEAVEQKTFETMQNIYHPEPTEQSTLNAEKVALRRRLNEIEQQENAVDPQIIEMKKRRLHAAVLRHRQEAALSNSVISTQFEQQTGPGGKFIFKT